MKARPIAEYHKDMGNVLWWKFPVDEPPYVGSPLSRGRTVEVHLRGTDDGSYKITGDVGGWPGYHTHWTPITIPDEPV